MTQGYEVTVAGKRYASAAEHISSLLRALRSRSKIGLDPIEVTVEPDAQLSPEEREALA